MFLHTGLLLIEEASCFQPSSVVFLRLAPIVRVFETKKEIPANPTHRTLANGKASVIGYIEFSRVTGSEMPQTPACVE